MNHAFLYLDESSETDLKRSGGGADVQSLWYQAVPLSQLPREEATNFCKTLYSPSERFAQGFYRYHRDITGMPEDEAWQATLDELNEYVTHLLNNLEDPRYHTIGFNQQDEYTPVGLYGFRGLEEHDFARKLIVHMKDTGLISQYPGKLAIAHSFSALNGYRNRALMKFAFLLIALEALRENYMHIFFFMSDYRLGPIYQRFGLQFPENLRFPDSNHLVGCYSITPENLVAIRQTAEQFGQTVPDNALAL